MSELFLVQDTDAVPSSLVWQSAAAHCVIGMPKFIDFAELSTTPAPGADDKTIDLSQKQTLAQCILAGTDKTNEPQNYLVNLEIERINFSCFVGARLTALKLFSSLSNLLLCKRRWSHISWRPGIIHSGLGHRRTGSAMHGATTVCV